MFSASKCESDKSLNVHFKMGEGRIVVAIGLDSWMKDSEFWVLPASLL